MEGGVAEAVGESRVGAVAQEESGDARAGAVLAGEQERRPAVLVLGVGIRRVPEEQLGHGGRVVQGRPVQGRALLLVEGSHARLVPQQELEQLDLASARR